MKTSIVIVGAGGKMGFRTAENLGKGEEYEVLHVEKNEQGLSRLKKQGMEVLSLESAMPKADVVILAVPDAARAFVFGHLQVASF